MLPSHAHQFRWLGEPVKAVSIATDIFVVNRKGTHIHTHHACTYNVCACTCTYMYADLKNVAAIYRVMTKQYFNFSCICITCRISCSLKATSRISLQIIQSIYTVHVRLLTVYPPLHYAVKCASCSNWLFQGGSCKCVNQYA